MLKPALLGIAIIAAATPFGSAIAATESFRRTCHDITVSSTTSGKIITATCNANRSACEDNFIPCFGATLPTRLIVPAGGCTDISNRNGVLVCYIQPIQVIVSVPAGSWRRSCGGAHYLKPTLFVAVCRANSGIGNTTKIDTSTCPQPLLLQNIDGRLECDR